jgi:beta-ketodecanoyl-[acyl-carrier-protein] synthase
MSSSKGHQASKAEVRPWTGRDILDPARMAPNIPSNDDLSIMARWPCAQAIAAWGRMCRDRRVLCAASNMPRGLSTGHRGLAGPGDRGFAFDINVACSSATFGIKTAADFVNGGSVRPC